MSVTWVQILQLFISLSILITLHELGHFVAAKYFKTRVDKFYLFFDFLFPLPSVLNFSLFKKKVGETEYGLGWFPLGGYVKIAGMVDESMDKEQMNLPPQPWEYRSKPAWQRLIIIMGGILVNFFLGMLIYIFVLAIWGSEYLPSKNLTYGIAVDSAVVKSGLRNGDKIISMDGKTYEDFTDIKRTMIISKPKQVVVERAGQQITVELGQLLDAETLDRMEKSRRGLIEARFPFEIAEVKNKGLLRAGMKSSGEKILSINGKKVYFYDEFKAEVEKNADKIIFFETMRDSSKKMTYKAKVYPDGTLGFYTKSPLEFLKTERREYNAFTAIPAGIKLTFSTLGTYVKSLSLLFDSKVRAYRNIGGFGAMASSTPKDFSLESFLIFTAGISIILAFMNFLPIPMLDGGYVVFILYEMITKKQPSERFMEITNYFGMIFLLGLMLYANGNDIYRSNFIQGLLK